MKPVDVVEGLDQPPENARYDYAGAPPAVVSVCVGARSAEQVERNAALYRGPIAPDLWSELKAEGLLRDDAPVPTWYDDGPRVFA